MSMLPPLLQEASRVINEEKTRLKTNYITLGEKLKGITFSKNSIEYKNFIKVEDMLLKHLSIYGAFSADLDLINKYKSLNLNHIYNSNEGN